MAKILIVEDDNHLREIYELRMQAAGHDVVSAADGEEALKVAIKEKPDLVISDVMMPKISGFDMLDILRSTEETKNAKVIMMTALSQAEDKQRAENLGADRYLVKSQVTLDDVAQVTEEVLSGKSASTTTEEPETPPNTEAPATAPAPEAPPTTQVVASAPATADPQGAGPSPVPAPAPDPVTTPHATPPSDDSVQQAPPVAVPPSPAPAPDPQPTQTVTPPSDTTTPAQPAPAPADDTATTDQPDTSTIDGEQAAIAKQIEDFMHTKHSEPPQTTAESPDTTESNQTDMNNDDGNGSEQSPSVASNEAPSKKKKVIQPLNDLNVDRSNELNSLLKKEEVKEEMSKIVTDIKTKDIADLSDDTAAEKALKEAQTEFDKVKEPQPAQHPSAENSQDIQISSDGSIVNEQAEEAAAAEALKAAQEANQNAEAMPVPTPVTEQSSSIQEPANESPSTQSPPAEAVQPMPQPAPAEEAPEVPPTPSAPTPEPAGGESAPSTPSEQQPAQQNPTPVIPHTNGTAIDGVMPQPAPTPTQQPPVAITPTTPPSSQVNDSPVASPAPQQQPATTQPDPNDIAL